MGRPRRRFARGDTTMSRRRAIGKRRRKGQRHAARAVPTPTHATPTPTNALDSLLPSDALAGAQAAGAREPPELAVEPPERLAARRARDHRDGVQVADPRRRGLYLGIAVVVAVVVLVFAVLSLIESRDLIPSLVPSP
jgi:hypothetical protein